MKLALAVAWFDRWLKDAYNGIDREPIAIDDEEQTRWLMACVWPDQHDRFQRLRAAIDIARDEPVRVIAGDAVESLAERYRVEVERESEDPAAEAKRRRRGRLYEVLERTAAFYSSYLWDSEKAAKAREYLAERGLGEEVLHTLSIPSPGGRSCRRLQTVCAMQPGASSSPSTCRAPVRASPAKCHPVGT